MKNACTAEKGFSLVEMMVAITIFAVGLLSIATMQLTAIQTNSSASATSVATALAEAEMEKFLALDEDDVFLRTAADNTQLWTNKTLDGGGDKFTATYSLAVDSPLSGLSTFTVIVRGQVRGRSATLTGFRRYEL